jgi:predicted RNase H-like nuclease (RuvC/YqgF family)
MRSTTLWRLAALLAFLISAALPALAQQDQTSDPVADAARKTREKQKNAPPPKKVYTNDDMPSAPPPAPVPASAARPADESAQSDASADTSADDKEKNPEAYWRKRFQKAHENLAKAEKELNVLQRELDKNQVQYYSDPQKALMQQNNRSDINEHTAKIAAKQKEVDSIKQQISDMEEELHKAGGDSGWAR